VRAEETLATTGLAGLMEAFARRISELFVRATRFDPLHRAETEQALYTSLPGWLEQLREQERIDAVLPHHDERLEVVLERDSVLGVAAGFYRAIVQLVAHQRQAGQSAVLQVADRVARLPGFAAELARLDDVHVEPLAPGHAAHSVLLQPELIAPSDGQVKLLKRLPWRQPAADLPVKATAAAPAARGVQRPTPTHVVYGGVVYPVGARGLVVGREPVDGRRVIVIADQASGVSRAHCEIVLRDGELKLSDLSRYGTYVNEKKISGEATLQAADVIRIGSPGAELQVVTMEAAE
jgi:hypothetical protein